MAKRSFDQYCPIARSLDVVGERWTLLLVRELLFGPKRYTDLRNTMTGMWTNLLALRLRELEDAGVLRRTELPPPAARTVYELTERGRALEPVLLALGAWGMALLDGARGQKASPATAVLGGLRAFFRAEAATNVNDNYALNVGSDVFAARVHQGELEVAAGDPDEPAATLTADPEALLGVRLGKIELDGAVRAKKISFRGSAGAVRRLRRVFALT